MTTFNPVTSSSEPVDPSQTVTEGGMYTIAVFVCMWVYYECDLPELNQDLRLRVTVPQRAKPLGEVILINQLAVITLQL